MGEEEAEKPCDTMTQIKALSDYTNRESSEYDPSPMGKVLQTNKQGASDPLTKLTQALLRSGDGDGDDLTLFNDDQKNAFHHY